MFSSLEQSILSALVYFDMFDYPLTLLELHRFLYRPARFALPARHVDASHVGWRSMAGRPEREYSVNEVREALSEPSLTRVVSFQEGFFYLDGRENIIRERQRRYRLSADKFRRARRIARFLAAAPFVRTVAVSGSLAYHNARLDSDIDLLILTKRGGVWWARFIAVACLHLLRLRPGQGGKADKICLSVFADEDNFDWQRLLLGKDDIDFIFWLADIYPLYGLDYYSRFWQANKWLKDYLPNIQPVAFQLSFLRKPCLPAGRQESIPKSILERLLAPFTPLVRRLQYALFPPAIRALMNKDTRVRVEQGLLKFHTTDRRKAYAAEFARRYHQF